MDTSYRIGGMTCGGCVRSVTAALEKAGMRAHVDLGSGTARVEGASDEANVRAAVERAGFDFGGVVDAPPA